MLIKSLVVDCVLAFRFLRVSPVPERSRCTLDRGWLIWKSAVTPMTHNELGRTRVERPQGRMGMAHGPPGRTGMARGPTPQTASN